MSKMYISLFGSLQTWKPNIMNIKAVINCKPLGLISRTLPLVLCLSAYRSLTDGLKISHTLIINHGQSSFNIYPATQY